MTQKSKWHKISIVGNILCLISLVFVILLPLIASEIIMFAGHNCKDIDLFFTNTSFKNDIIHFNMKFIYQPKNDTYIKSLREINKSMTGCCIDKSHVIYCLASKYNKTCRLYTVLTTEPRFQKKYNKTYVMHLGIDCLENGRWIKMN